MPCQNLIIFLKERVLFNYLFVNHSLCILTCVLSFSFLKLHRMHWNSLVCINKNVPWTFPLLQYADRPIFFSADWTFRSAGTHSTKVQL